MFELFAALAFLFGGGLFGFFGLATLPARTAIANALYQILNPFFP